MIDAVLAVFGALGPGKDLYTFELRKSMALTKI